MSLIRMISFFPVVLSVVSLYAADSLSFPAFGSPREISGELVSADFIHRTGQIRASSGVLTPFTMPPFAIMTYRGADADLRDVPLGTKMDFLLTADEDGELNRLVATKHSASVDEAQHKRFVEFIRERGLAGGIERTEGKTLTVTFFSGSPKHFAATWAEEFSTGKDVSVCVANDELRTWNSATTAERGKIIAASAIPVRGHGCSGWQVVIQVSHMLEGFRRGRVVRVLGPGWKARNQPFHECLVNYGYSHSPDPDYRENMARHYPEQFPFRTDYGNRHLPWLLLKEGGAPPQYAEHRMFGELTAIDNETKSGEFKTERSGTPVRFTLFSTTAKPPIRFRANNFEGTNAKFADLQLGIRYRFHMFMDDTGKFTRCTFISDDASHQALNSQTYHIQKIDLAAGYVEVTWQRLPVQNYFKEKETPPPLGHSRLHVTPETRVWKDDRAANLAELKVGDYLRANFTAELPGHPTRCADLWIVSFEQLSKRR